MHPDKTEYYRKTQAVSNGTTRQSIVPKSSVGGLWTSDAPDRFKRKAYAAWDGVRTHAIRPKNTVKKLWTAVVPDRFARKTFATVTPSGNAVAAKTAANL